MKTIPKRAGVQNQRERENARHVQAKQTEKVRGMRNRTSWTGECRKRAPLTQSITWRQHTPAYSQRWHKCALPQAGAYIYKMATPNVRGTQAPWPLLNHTERA